MWILSPISRRSLRFRTATLRWLKKCVTRPISISIGLQLLWSLHKQDRAIRIMHELARDAPHPKTSEVAHTQRAGYDQVDLVGLGVIYNLGCSIPTGKHGGCLYPIPLERSAGPR